MAAGCFERSFEIEENSPFLSSTKSNGKQSTHNLDILVFRENRKRVAVRTILLTEKLIAFLLLSG